MARARAATAAQHASRIRAGMSGLQGASHFPMQTLVRRAHQVPASYTCLPLLCWASVIQEASANSGSARAADGKGLRCHSCSARQQDQGRHVRAAGLHIVPNAKPASARPPSSRILYCCAKLVWKQRLLPSVALPELLMAKGRAVTAAQHTSRIRAGMSGLQGASHLQCTGCVGAPIRSPQSTPACRCFVEPVWKLRLLPSVALPGSARLLMASACTATAAQHSSRIRAGMSGLQGAALASHCSIEMHVRSCAGQTLKLLCSAAAAAEERTTTSFLRG